MRLLFALNIFIIGLNLLFYDFWLFLSPFLLFGIVFVAIPIGLFIAWVKVFKNPVFKGKVILFSVLFIFQELLCLSFPIEGTLNNRDQVHTLKEFIQWLMNSRDYVMYCLLMILVLVCNIIYFNQPKFKR